MDPRRYGFARAYMQEYIADDSGFFIIMYTIGVLN